MRIALTFYYKLNILLLGIKRMIFILIDTFLQIFILEGNLMGLKEIIWGENDYKFIFRSLLVVQLCL